MLYWIVMSWLATNNPTGEGYYTARLDMATTLEVRDCYQQLFIDGVAADLLAAGYNPVAPPAHALDAIYREEVGGLCFSEAAYAMRDFTDTCAEELLEDVLTYMGYTSLYCVEYYGEEGDDDED